MLLPVPTYSMYEVYASGTAARIVAVPAEEGFRFPLAAILDAITPATRLIAIANPNSPTGQAVRREDLLRVIEAAPQAAVLVDEAYFHFFGETVIDLVGRIPNVIVARTFSKAYGLAGLRLGVLAAGEDAMQWMRRAISPYSVNSVALACLTAALDDEDYLRWYSRRGSRVASGVRIGIAADRLAVLAFAGELRSGEDRPAKHRAFVDAMRAARHSGPGSLGGPRLRRVRADHAGNPGANAAGHRGAARPRLRRLAGRRRSDEEQDGQRRSIARHPRPKSICV